MQHYKRPFRVTHGVRLLARVKYFPRVKILNFKRNHVGDGEERSEAPPMICDRDVLRSCASEKFCDKLVGHKTNGAHAHLWPDSRQTLTRTRKLASDNTLCTSHCFSELLDPQCGVDGVALLRIGIKDHQPVDAIDPATVENLILKISEENKKIITFFGTHSVGPLSDLPWVQESDAAAATVVLVAEGRRDEEEEEEGEGDPHLRVSH